MAKPKIVGVVSQKGGVGKSTLCQLITREAAVQGTQVKILDFDVQQMTSTDWVRARLERDGEPAIEAEPTKNLDKALKHSKGYDIIVLDGAPGAPKRTAGMVPACDQIILPTGASRADLMPGLALARRIAEMKLATDKPDFALCRVMIASGSAEARAVIGDAGFETFEGELTERPGSRQAQNFGRRPTETVFPSLNGQAGRFARSILDRLAWNAIPLGAVSGERRAWARRALEAARP